MAAPRHRSANSVQVSRRPFTPPTSTPPSGFPTLSRRGKWTPFYLLWQDETNCSQYRLGQQLQHDPLPVSLWWVQGVRPWSRAGFVRSRELHAGQDRPDLPGRCALRLNVPPVARRRGSDMRRGEKALCQFGFRVTKSLGATQIPKNVFPLVEADGSTRHTFCHILPLSCN
jgi:hypothetical protein